LGPYRAWIHSPSRWGGGWCSERFPPSCTQADHQIWIGAGILPTCWLQNRAGKAAPDNLAPAGASPRSARRQQARHRALFSSGTLRVIAAASAPSARIHFASGFTPTSSKIVESGTPVHSQQEISPCVR